MPAKIIAPVITPRDASGSVDIDGLRSNLGRLASEPLDGFLALGSSGEYVYLSDEERRRVVSAVLAEAHGRSVYVQVGGDTTARSLALAEWAMGQGAAAVLAVTPTYYTPQLKGAALDAFYRELGAIAPTYLYHIPPYTGMALGTEDILRLSDIAGVVGVKDSSGSLGLLVEILAAKPNGFTYFVGSGGALLAALAHGADGTIAALANLLPGGMRIVADRIGAGDLAGAREVQAPLARLNALVTGRYGIPGLKYAASRLGYAAGSPFPPLQPISREAQEAIDRALDEAMEATR